jgi:hypothetical protein
MIIGLSGYARSGKDTIANILVEEGFKRVAFSDALQKCMIAFNPIIDWDLVNNVPIRYVDLVEELGYDKCKELYPEFRRSLQFMATEVGRNTFDENIWLNFVTDRINAEPNQDWVITDCRFRNEIKAVEDAGGFIWRVMRYGYNGANNHISEHELDNYNFDEIIFNNGSIDDLKEKVLSRIKNVK